MAYELKEKWVRVELFPLNAAQTKYHNTTSLQQ